MTRYAAMLWIVFAVPGQAEVAQGPANAPHFEPAFENQTRAPEIGETLELRTEIVAGGLEHPWGVEPLPGGGYLVTERVGRLQYVSDQGEVRQMSGVPSVLAKRQGGLLDVALAPDFDTSRRIYLTYAKRRGWLKTATAVATAVVSDDFSDLLELRDIFIQSPASSTAMHFGSRVLIRDQEVFVTLGEHSTPTERVLAQDLRTTYGKVVRISPEGGAPPDNPFAGQRDAMAEIWSYGHRNPQGAAFHPVTRALWTLEHGPAGGDELNLIEPGGNYGWPMVSYGVNYSGTPVGTGRSSAEGVIEPRYYWDPVIAPGGFVFYDGAMFDWQGDVVAGSLNPGGIVRLRMNGDRVAGEARYLEDLGRVRDVDIDHDGALLILIDDSDGALIRVVREDA